MTTPEYRAELRRLSDAATPEPWNSMQGSTCKHVRSADGSFETGCIIFARSRTPEYPLDAEFIAAAREAVPLLLDEVEWIQRMWKTDEKRLNDEVARNGRLEDENKRLERGLASRILE